MTADEWHQEVNGTLHAVVLACSSMIATHPEKEKVLALLQALSKQATDELVGNPEKPHYMLGIQSAVSEIQKSVETARLAEEVLSVKRQTGSH